MALSRQVHKRLVEVDDGEKVSLVVELLFELRQVDFKEFLKTDDVRFLGFKKGDDFVKVAVAFNVEGDELERHRWIIQ